MMKLHQFVAASLLSVSGLVFAQPADPEPKAKNSVAAAPAEAYKGEKGPYAVGEKDLTLKDSARGKDLELRVRWPKPKEPRGEKVQSKAGPFPVIVFSHGAGGSSTAFAELSAHWAGHGFVVIHPTHSDSTKLRVKDGGLKPGALDPKEVIAGVRPMDRHQDVKFILDSLDKIEREITANAEGDGKPLFDRDKIGMAGHSAGAYTTQILFGARTSLGPLTKLRSYADPRIKAAILISGQGLEKKTFDKDSWAEITGPMMVITGSLDQIAATNETPQTRRHPYELAKPGDKYLIFIEGATHGSYQGKGASKVLGEKPTTDIKVITAVTAAGTLAFWDAYLNHDDAAKAYLRSEKLKVFSGGKAELSHK